MEMGGRQALLLLALNAPGTDYGTRSDSGHSRVSASGRPEGCIAKALALTPWLRDGETEAEVECPVFQGEMRWTTEQKHTLGLFSP